MPSARAEQLRQSRLELRRCQNNSWYLATAYLGYEWNPDVMGPKIGRHQLKGRGLVDRIHKPLCKWRDRNFDEPFLGLTMARGRHKTTLVVTWIIQAILRNPCLSHRYWHASETLAVQTLLEVVSHLRFNKKLRDLEPIGTDADGKFYRVLPRGNATRWYKTGKGDAQLTVNRHTKYGAGVRSPTLYAQGAASEATGAHIDGEAWLDDIISMRTIRNSELGKVKDWFEHTVFNIVDSKKIRGTWTPWSDFSILQEWMASPDWRTVVLPAAIAEDDATFHAMIDSNEKKVHFAPDYKFTNPVFGPASYREDARRMLQFEQKHEGASFSPQIMLDSEPETEKPWSEGACEHYTGLKQTQETPGIGGPGVVVLLGDPAPWLAGGFKGLGEKKRGDGTKDYWSFAVVKLRVRGTCQDIILLDGSHSQEWGMAAGADEACRLMRKWGTTLFFTENPREHWDFMTKAALRHGVSLTRDRDGGPLRFADYNKADGKNTRFIALADKAKLGEVWLSETLPDGFLNGDGVHTGFLTQARKWRKIGPGKNSLRFDDDADVVSRATDAALQAYAPQPDTIDSTLTGLWTGEEDDDVVRRSRYGPI